MKNRPKRRDLLTAAGVGLAGLAGCSDLIGGGNNRDIPGDAENQSEGWEVKLGVLAPQSGSLETFGDEFTNVVELVERQLAASAGGFTLDTAVRDTESDPDTAASAAQELVDEGYQALVGPGSGEVAATVAEEVLVPESVPTVSPLAATGITELDDEDFLFSTTVRASAISQSLSRPIATAGTNSASIVHTANGYGTTIADSVSEGLELRGIDVPAQVGIEDFEASSYTSVLEEAMADDPESLVVAADPVTGTQLLKDFYAEYESRPVFLTDRLRLPDLPSQVDSDMADVRAISQRPRWEYSERQAPETTVEGTADATAVGEDADLLQPFHKAYQTAFEEFPTIQAAQTFDATVVLALASIGAGEGNYSGDVIQDRIRNVSNEQTAYDGVRLFGQHNYWEGTSVIADGVRNNYIGAAGDVEFDTGTGQQKSPYLQAVKFAPETDSGFEETLSIPT